MSTDLLDPEWQAYVDRFRQGEWRGTIFRDLVLRDVRTFRDRNISPVLLDIGCGHGFDGDLVLQQSIAAAAGRYLGVEPASDVTPADVFARVHRCRFEDAPLEPGSVHVAFAVMVLEHLDEPGRFWHKVHDVLAPDGVFWGFTVDARHWFVNASLAMEKLRIKDLYLNLLHGRRGEDRYNNYGVFYRSNTPGAIASQTAEFSSMTELNFHRVGQMDYYVPRPLRWMSRTLDRAALRAGWPGSILAVRLTR